MGISRSALFNFLGMHTIRCRPCPDLMTMDNQDFWDKLRWHYRVGKNIPGQSRCVSDRWRIRHIPDDDLKILKRWRRSPEKKKWERAVVLLDSHAGICIHLLAAKIERHCKVVKRWIKAYLKSGLSGIPPRKRPGRPTQKELERLEEKKRRIVEILHQSPSLYNVNRTSWSLRALAETYKAEHGEYISACTVSNYIRSMGYRFRMARVVLTSPDPNYRAKLKNITRILSRLTPREKFFSIDEYGPFSVKIHGGKSLVKLGEVRTVPQWQKSKGRLIATAALELSTNQITHFYSRRKDSEEMIKLLMMLLEKYAGQDRIFLSWDAASWHSSRKFVKRVRALNRASYRKTHGTPAVTLAPLPCSAQFLNVIESVFSGMSKAIIHNSNYGSVEECKRAINRYIAERNRHFRRHPSRAGDKIWGKERIRPVFSHLNNCKDPNWR